MHDCSAEGGAAPRAEGSQSPVSDQGHQTSSRCQLIQEHRRVHGGVQMRVNGGEQSHTGDNSDCRGGNRSGKVCDQFACAALQFVRVLLDEIVV